MIIFARTLGLAAMLGAASGCMSADVTRSQGMAQGMALDGPIGPLANPAVVDSTVGTCFARDTTPAVIETVTEQIEVQPAVLGPDGGVVQPATFQTVTRQRIVRERREVEFETPCAHVMTRPFLASVQRALLARGYYRGSISGELDPRTLRAIEKFQTDQGDVPTNRLTLRTARHLGLVAHPRDT